MTSQCRNISEYSQQNQERHEPKCGTNYGVSCVESILDAVYSRTSVELETAPCNIVNSTTSQLEALFCAAYARVVSKLATGSPRASSPPYLVGLPPLFLEASSGIYCRGIQLQTFAHGLAKGGCRILGAASCARRFCNSVLVFFALRTSTLGECGALPTKSLFSSPYSPSPHTPPSPPTSDRYLRVCANSGTSMYCTTEGMYNQIACKNTANSPQVSDDLSQAHLRLQAVPSSEGCAGHAQHRTARCVPHFR